MSRKLPGSAIVSGSITLTQITGSLNDTTNAAYAQANSARDQANTARSDANTTFATINTTFATLNTSAGTQNTNIGLAYDQANSARGQANTAYGQANAAYGQANAAYGAANTRLSASGGTLSGDLIITGNLTVSGNQTILNTEVLTTEDADIILLSNVAGTPALNAGLIVNRGTSTNTFIRWAENVDEWGWSDNGTVTYFFDDLRQGLITTNTTFGTINTNITNTNSNALNAYASANLAYTQANNARSDANTTFATVNTTFATINTTTATMNTATSNRVLKAGDTMTGQLNVSSGGLLVTGNVGIGTASPSKALHTFSSSESLLVDGSATWGGAIQIKGGGGANTWQIQSTGTGAGEGANKLIFAQKDISATLMTITSGGNVGIGITNPWSRLTITAASVSWGEGITINPAPNGYSAVYFRTESATNDSATNSWAVGKNASNQTGGELLHVVRNGLTGSLLHRVDAVQSWQPAGNSCFGFNVGIGVTNPRVPLDLGSTNNRAQVILLGETGANNRTGFGLDSSTAGMRIFTINASDQMIDLGGISSTNGTTWTRNHRFGIAGGNTWLNEQGGNVGIGLTNPGARLHVSGDSYFTGGAYFLDSTVYGNYARSNNYPSKGYSGATDRFWLELGARGGVHVVLNTDGGANAAENDSDDFAIFQGTRDSGDNLFRVMNSGKVLTKHSHFIGNTHNTAQQSEFGTSAINTYLTAGTNVNTLVESYENRSGVYWLNFNGQIFRAYIKANWLQGRNWVLAAKFFDAQDMPSGSSLWTNDTYVNEGDFDIYSGKFSKYKSWRYFSFDRLAMQMGDRVAPIMQFSASQTLFGAFSGGRAGNGGGVTASSTDPQIGNSATYHNMTNYIGPNFTDIAGAEDIMQSYGLNKWANSSTNSTSGNNQGSRSYNSGTLRGFQLSVEDSHPNISGMDSVGVAGAWIGCPMDEGGFTFGTAASNGGADSGFGFGFGCGNNPRTGTSGYAEWARGNEVVNLLPAYVWLSID